MADPSETEGNIDLIRHLRVVQFAMLGVVAALLLAATDTQERFDRALQQLEMLEVLAMRLVEEPAAIQRVLRQRVASDLGSGYLEVTIEKLNAGFLVPSVRNGDADLFGLPLDWEIEPYLMVDVDWLHDSKYYGRFGHLPDKAQRCDVRGSRYVEGEAYHDYNPAVRGQRLMPLRPALGFLFRFPTDPGNGTQKTVVSRMPTVATLRELWNALEHAQIWIIDHQRLEDASLHVLDRQKLERIEPEPTIRWSGVLPNLDLATIQPCSQEAPRPPLLKAHMVDRSSSTVARRAFLSVNFNNNLLAALRSEFREGSGGVQTVLLRQAPLYELVLPARVLPAAVFRRDLAALMGGEHPRLVAPFDLAFPDLVSILGPILDLPPTAMHPALEHLRNIDRSTIGIFGFSFRKADLQFWGGLALALTQLYFLVHLQLLARRLEAADPARYAPWVALYPGWMPALLFVVFLIVLPPIAASIGPIGGLWAAGGPWLAYLDATKIPFALIAALVASLISLGLAIATCRTYLGLRRRLGFSLADG